MQDENSIWFHDADAPYMHLIADLGLFDVKICYGPKPLLEDVKEKLQKHVTAPLKIVFEKELKGIEPQWSAVPTGFTVKKGGMCVPEVVC